MAKIKIEFGPNNGEEQVVKIHVDSYSYRNLHDVFRVSADKVTQTIREDIYYYNTSNPYLTQDLDLAFKFGKNVIEEYTK